jgi:hypothetical protein
MHSLICQQYPSTTIDIHDDDDDDDDDDAMML